MELVKKLIAYCRDLMKDKDKKRWMENCVILIIIGIVILIAGGTLFGGADKKEGKEKTEATDAEQVSKAVTSQEKQETEKRMETILSQIDGAGKVEVMITYLSGNEVVPAYDIKKSENETAEKDNGGGTRNIKQSDIENKIVYEEGQGVKKPVIVKEIQPPVKGVVIVADGASDPVVKEKLSRAVQVLTDVPIHKVQVFERRK